MKFNNITGKIRPSFLLKMIYRQINRSTLRLFSVKNVLCLRIFVVNLNPSLCRFETWDTRPKYDFKWNYSLVKWTILTHHFSPIFTPSTENVKGKKRVRINEDPLLHIVDDSKSSRAARVPSFYIGKPLVDFDGGFASVSRTQLLTSKLSVTLRGEVTLRGTCVTAERYDIHPLIVIYWRHVRDVLKHGGEYWQRFPNWLCKVQPNLVPLETTKPSEESCGSFSQISPYSQPQLN